MKHRRLVAVLTTLALALSMGATAHAGLTDAIKSKVKAIKKEPKAEAAATEEGANKSRMTPPVTPEMLDRFQAALEIQIAEMEKAKKELAAYKSQDDYAQCSQAVMASPEALKIMEVISDLPENATSEQSQKAVTQMGEQMQKLVASKCGPDPAEVRVRRDQLMRDALAKGSDAFVKDDNAYYVWKEWVVPFCEYIEELKKGPDADAKIAKIKDEGLRIPGSGKGIFFVYTASETNELLERCDRLMPLVKATM